MDFIVLSVLLISILLIKRPVVNPDDCVDCGALGLSVGVIKAF